MLLAALAALGCERDPNTSTRSRGAPEPARGPRARAVTPPLPGTPGRSRSSRRPRPRPPTSSAAAEEDRTATPPPNSLEEELRRRFGTPTECISSATRDRLHAGPDELTVQVQAVVTSTGRITRASVRSAHLGEDDLACMRRRLESRTLQGRVERAPRSVSTDVRFHVHSRRPEPEAAPAPQVPRAVGAVEPDRVLEAAGSVHGRPTGSVAPDHTLPAEGSETERPAGSVEPSLTLPAQAPPINP